MNEVDYENAGARLFGEYDGLVREKCGNTEDYHTLIRVLEGLRIPRKSVMESFIQFGINGMIKWAEQNQPGKI
ncbi:MAG: hypothetical protein OXI05_03930 [Bacteroidota bacterium]|nr:hypothetical protein [Bacteroidota bacterium]MXW13622.1 hypothetical protein [Rhodothermaceae bacterium]MXW33093.1 hypothetical protein [Rhodothermaceae bacterium]MXZ17936.1 hypothetical protein [Rhodothermaceae bacterium]MYC05441.1 hypothetical protein [Rhodothermaceae bacterium]